MGINFFGDLTWCDGIAATWLRLHIKANTKEIHTKSDEDKLEYDEDVAFVLEEYQVWSDDEVEFLLLLPDE